ncbi:MAG: hypothetical protein AB4040_18010 [Synechococcus sp.]
MQPVTRDVLEQLIQEAQQAGKDTTDLESALSSIATISPPIGTSEQPLADGSSMVIESTGPARLEDFEPIQGSAGGKEGGNSEEQTMTAEVATDQVHSLGEFLSLQGELPETLASIADRIRVYRHDWGDKKGVYRLNLNWRGVKGSSLAFVSIGEGAPNGKHLGNARFTLHNVCPRPNGINIRVEVDWDDPLRIYVDYLVII